MRAMKQITLLLLLLGFALTANAQRDSLTTTPPKKKYNPFHFETFMGVPNITWTSAENNGEKLESVVRFPNMAIRASAIANLRVLPQVDLYAGISHNDIGIIFKDSIKHKYRVFTAGIPFGISIGSKYKKTRKKMIRPEKFKRIFAGAELYFPYHFKEKHFIDGGKTKDGEFLSDKAEKYFLGFHAGITFAHAKLKFEYIPGGFLNSSYSENVNSVVIKPYEQFNFDTFSISYESAFGGGISALNGVLLIYILIALAGSDF
jgi:hypothetical protein